VTTIEAKKDVCLNCMEELERSAEGGKAQQFCSVQCEYDYAFSEDD